MEEAAVVLTAEQEADRDAFEEAAMRSERYAEALNDAVMSGFDIADAYTLAARAVA